MGQGSKQQRESVKDNKREAGEKPKRRLLIPRLLGVRLEVFGGWGNPGLKGSWVPTWATGRGSDAQLALPAPQGTEGQLIWQGTGKSDLWLQVGLTRHSFTQAFPSVQRKFRILFDNGPLSDLV